MFHHHALKTLFLRLKVIKWKDIHIPHFKSSTLLGSTRFTCLLLIWYRKEPPYVFISNGHPIVCSTSPGLCFPSSISHTWNRHALCCHKFNNWLVHNIKREATKWGWDHPYLFNWSISIQRLCTPVKKKNMFRYLSYIDIYFI